MSKDEKVQYILEESTSLLNNKSLATVEEVTSILNEIKSFLVQDKEFFNKYPDFKLVGKELIHLLNHISSEPAETSTSTQLVRSSQVQSAESIERTDLVQALPFKNPLGTVLSKTIAFWKREPESQEDKKEKMEDCLGLLIYVIICCCFLFPDLFSIIRSFTIYTGVFSQVLRVVTNYLHVGNPLERLCNEVLTIAFQKLLTDCNTVDLILLLIMFIPGINDSDGANTVILILSVVRIAIDLVTRKKLLGAFKVLAGFLAISFKDQGPRIHRRWFGKKNFDDIVEDVNKSEEGFSMPSLEQFKAYRTLDSNESRLAFQNSLMSMNTNATVFTFGLPTESDKAMYNSILQLQDPWQVNQMKEQFVQQCFDKGINAYLLELPEEEGWSITTVAFVSIAALGGSLYYFKSNPTALTDGLSSSISSVLESVPASAYASDLIPTQKQIAVLIGGPLFIEWVKTWGLFQSTTDKKLLNG